jgi:hypothetical protein
MVAQHQAPGNRLQTVATGASSSSQTPAINDRPDSSWSGGVSCEYQPWAAMHSFVHSISR